MGAPDRGICLIAWWALVAAIGMLHVLGVLSVFLAGFLLAAHEWQAALLFFAAIVLAGTYEIRLRELIQGVNESLAGIPK